MKECFNIMKIQEFPPKPSDLLFFLPFFIFGLIVVYSLYIQGKERKSKFSLVPLIIFLVIWILLTVGYFTLQKNTELIKLKELFTNGNYEIVEGTVNNFDPMPYGGHKQETFDVNGIKFSYSDYGTTVGYRDTFRNTRSHGGPIYAGVYVKIYYIHDENFNDNFIIGLWIKEN
jgi:energy-coupling factor transporter transmembrane protein EcfT